MVFTRSKLSENYDMRSEERLSISNDVFYAEYMPQRVY
jgi:hypothetical protein